MKNIFKISLIGLIIFGATVSCEESDVAIDTLYEEVDTSGSILRILDFPEDVVNLSGNPPLTNNIEFIMEVQEGAGTPTPDFKEVRIYLSSFKDQDGEFPNLDVDGNELGEILYRTISAAGFEETSEVNGFPQTTFAYTTPEFIEAFPTGDFGAANFIVTRFELEMNDGRVWSQFNAGTTLTGPYLSSPFTKTTIFLNN